MGEHVLGILPSRGLGGGIERYWDWLRGVAADGGIEVEELALLSPGDAASLLRKGRFALRIVVAARTMRHVEGVDVVVAHPNLAVMAWVACRLSGLDASRFVVAFYGTDVWGLGRFRRWALARMAISPVSISSFAAGALAPIGPPTIVAPGIAEPWFRLLTGTGAPTGLATAAGRGRPASAHGPVHVLTVFRLDDPGKGLQELVDALDQVRSRTGVDIHLEVAGSGTLPDDARAMVGARAWITVTTGLSDEDLAASYHQADIFVLATRTTFRAPLSGEGFGIVLVEAQLAGTPVVAPAHGGSDDAFLDGITGVKPVDESAEALADAIEPLVVDPELRQALADNACAWSRAAFEPGRRNAHVRRLLGWDRNGDDGDGAGIHDLGLRLSPRSVGDSAQG